MMQAPVSIREGCVAEHSPRMKADGASADVINALREEEQSSSDAPLACLSLMWSPPPNGGGLSYAIGRTCLGIEIKKS